VNPDGAAAGEPGTAAQNGTGAANGDRDHIGRD
jgi:hypothetical protein